jgi:ComF family protein
MNLIDDFIGVFAPHTCLGCSAEGTLLCTRCFALLPSVPERCYRCRKLSNGAKTCHSCRRSSHLYAVHVASVYDSLAKQLVWRLKFDGAQAAAAEIALHLRALLSKNYRGETYIVPVPTATKRARQRGYDQAKLLAKQLANRTDGRYFDCLRRTGQAHQVGAGRRERLLQLNGAFRVPYSLPDRAHIILIDDVVTTGATLEAAAQACRQAGAARVEALVFAQP